MGKILQVSVSLICSLATCAIAFWAAPQFAEIYRAFALPLPLPTRLLLAGYPAVLALPLLVAAIWWRWERLRNPADTVLAIGIGGSAAFLIIGSYLVYSPIFELGTQP